MDRKIAGVRLYVWGLVALAAAVGLYVYTRRHPKGYDAEQSPWSAANPQPPQEGIGSGTTGQAVGPISEPFRAPQAPAFQELAPVYEPAPLPVGPEAGAPEGPPLVAHQNAQPSSAYPPSQAGPYMREAPVTAAEVLAVGRPIVLGSAMQEARPGEAPTVASQRPQPAEVPQVIASYPQPQAPNPYPAATATVASIFGAGAAGEAAHRQWVKEHSH